ncbi:hypothetical protein PDESU_04676 [Pontiella desulfatans]|uniref:Uncharacterized protein n=1 Tax=Pontiella desulfatans TaxID=2750659 RepID=A0A6C2U9M8_PONDE|nr:hypothetical protein PDESU_04676 [Pontiella desulfatans]
MAVPQAARLHRRTGNPPRPKGRRLINVMIERFWRRIKHEDIRECMGA